MVYHAISCNKYHAIPWYTMQYHAISCNIMQYHAISCNIICTTRNEVPWHFCLAQPPNGESRVELLSCSARVSKYEGEYQSRERLGQFSFSVFPFVCLSVFLLYCSAKFPIVCFYKFISFPHCNVA